MTELMLGDQVEEFSVDIGCRQLLKGENSYSHHAAS